MDQVIHLKEVGPLAGSLLRSLQSSKRWIWRLYGPELDESSQWMVNGTSICDDSKGHTRPSRSLSVDGYAKKEDDDVGE